MDGLLWPWPSSREEDLPADPITAPARRYLPLVTLHRTLSGCPLWSWWLRMSP